MGKLVSSSHNPGAYLLRAQNQVRAFEPEAQARSTSKLTHVMLQGGGKYLYVIFH